MPRVLVVDDEEAIQEFLELGLSQSGMSVCSALDGSSGERAIACFAPHLIILDLMLPDIDGVKLCQNIRERSDVPILMLTARGSVEDKVAGLQSGADDYLSKPFKFKELLARVHALLRRSGRPTGHLMTFGDLVLDRSLRRVSRAGEDIGLAGREMELLELLMSRPRHVFTREQILARLWGYDFSGHSNVVEVYVRSLRQKLHDESKTLIRAVRGIGYTLGG
ncbi:MAG: response regulator transcription factor [Candidatus Xenobia bacterium]